MPKSTSVLLGFAAAVLAFSTVSVAAARDENPDSNKWKITTVHWIIAAQNDLDMDNKKVTLIGKVTKKLNGDSFVFDDGTGSIRLDSDIDLPINQSIVIRGEIDQAYLHIGPLEVDVHNYRMTDKTDLAPAKLDPVKNGS